MSVNGSRSRFRRINFGYARVSTADQNPDHQIDALLRAGVDRASIHLDTASGAKASRPRLDLVLQLLREGDTLKVTRLDRLSRSVLHLVTLGADLRTRKIGPVSPWSRWRSPFPARRDNGRPEGMSCV